MKISIAILATALALGLTSCGGSDPAPQTSNNNPMRPGDAGSGPAVAGTGRITQPGASSDGSRMEGDAPPQDAQFTLFCDAIHGPNHVAVATAIKERLGADPSLHTWHILHSADQSAIFYGYYRTFDNRNADPQEVARAQADLKKIESLKNAQGDRLFAHAIFLPINNPDPLGAPPEWNLTNTPATAYWSLQIGAYQGSPDRKQYAVEAVRGLRSTGVEAYYFHGETISSVCIGAWPMDAVKRQDAAAGGSPDPNDIVMVLGGLIPPIENNMHDAQGNHIIVEAPKLEILDSTMAKAIRKYPEHAVNGDVMWKTTKNGTKIPSPSFVVLIPHSDGPPAPMIPLSAPKVTASTGAQDAAGAIVDDAKPVGDGRGTLRSLPQP